MIYLVVILCVVIGALLLWGIVWPVLYFQLKNKMRDVPGYETQAILSDMMAKGCLLKLERIDPQDVFLRRPT